MNRTEQKRVIRKHYSLDRPVTDTELDAEIANLLRRDTAGTLSDWNERLFAKLRLADHPDRKPFRSARGT